MIRVTVELLSSSGSHDDKVVGLMYLTNDGTGDETFGNYVIDVSDRHVSEGWRKAALFGHRRINNVWSLILESIVASHAYQIDQTAPSDIQTARLTERGIRKGSE